MAGKGMGAATRGGGAVMSGPKNRMISEDSKTTGPAMMNKGGMMSKGYAAGGMMSKGYAAGGVAKKKAKAGGARSR
tara:strand:+ start:129 stop:356 length:228 start_codon:yes stop_codon:yes gene_type:complete